MIVVYILMIILTCIATWIFINSIKTINRMNYLNDVIEFLKTDVTNKTSLQEKLDNTERILSLIDTLIDIEIVKILRTQLFIDDKKIFPAYQFDIQAIEIANNVTNAIITSNNIDGETTFTSDELVKYVALNTSIRLSLRITEMNKKR